MMVLYKTEGSFQAVSVYYEYWFMTTSQPAARGTPKGRDPSL